MPSGLGRYSVTYNMSAIQMTSNCFVSDERRPVKNNEKHYKGSCGYWFTGKKSGYREGLPVRWLKYSLEAKDVGVEQRVLSPWDCGTASCFLQFPFLPF